MFKKRSTWIIVFLALGIVFWLGLDLIKFGDPNKLKGGFKEVTTYRNENNTGPVQLIYVVTVADTVQAEYANYGEMMPHFKYGITKVYFFPENQEHPQELRPGSKNFDDRFNKNCIALYEKFAMGNSAFTKHPFK